MSRIAKNLLPLFPDFLPRFSLRPNLRDLELCASDNEAYIHNSNPHETFDARLLSFGLSMPALTTITIKNEVIVYLPTLIVLCRMAPNLGNLHLNTAGVEIANNHPLAPKFPGKDTPFVNKQLRSLRIYIRYGTEDGYDEAYDANLAYELPGIAAILRASPGLGRVTVQSAELHEGSTAGIMTILAGMKDLQELQISLPLSAEMKSVLGKGNFPSLKKLQLRTNEHMDIIRWISGQSYYDTLS